MSDTNVADVPEEPLCALTHIIYDNQANVALLNENKRYNSLLQVLSQVSLLETDVILRFFRDEMSSYSMPIELLCALEKWGIIYLSTYMHIRKSFVNKDIEEGLLYLVKNNDNSKCKIILSEILKLLLMMYLEECNQAQYIIRSFISKIIAGVMEGEEMVIGDYLSEMLATEKVYEPCLCEFFLDHLNILLTYNSEEIVETEAIMYQSTKYTTSTAPSNIVKFLKTILSALEEQMVLEVIARKISENKFNWRCMLMTVSVYLVTFENASSNLKILTEGLFKKGLTEESNGILMLAMLLVRQWCMEQENPYAAYADWFSKLRLIDQKEFRQFFDFLTYLVPYELPVFIKSHISKMPCVANNCNMIVSDFIALSKTRLCDLNESTQVTGLFSDNRMSSQQKPWSDVDRVLGHFDRTGDVLNIVMEAHLLRRDYYLNCFLKELMQTSNKDQHLRNRFIEKLYTIGKIPHSIYSSWKTRQK